MSSSEGDDETQNTRPISVAELLARNGTIGAPPAGGHRRRRRGNPRSVSVSELTGEIPVIREVPQAADEVVEEVVATAAEAAVVVVEEPVVEEAVLDDAAVEGELVEEAVGEEAVGEDEMVDESVVEGELAEEEVFEEAVAEEEFAEEEVFEEAVVEGELAEEEVFEEAVAEESVVEESVAESVEVVEVDTTPPLSSDPLPRRGQGPELSHDPRPVRRGLGAEQMNPDPVDQSVDLAELVADQAGEVEELRAYLQSSSGALFGGETVADDLARRGVVTDSAEASVPPAEVRRVKGSKLAALRNATAAVLQSVLAVAFGAGLFLGFDQLWRWNTIVALALSVLVILGLVVAVRVVRKTEDIASTLIAVAVGALVTLGPLALLQST